MDTTKARAWVVANKVKTGLSLVAALASVIVLPISFVAWSAEQTAEQIREAELIREGREEVIHSAQKATHDYDFYDLRAAQAERDLIELEQAELEGVQLTPTQKRRMRNLEADLEEFETRKSQALEDLQNVESHHETD